MKPSDRQNRNSTHPARTWSTEISKWFKWKWLLLCVVHVIGRHHHNGLVGTFGTSHSADGHRWAPRQICSRKGQRGGIVVHPRQTVRSGRSGRRCVTVHHVVAVSAAISAMAVMVRRHVVGRVWRRFRRRRLWHLGRQPSQRRKDGS